MNNDKLEKYFSEYANAYLFDSVYELAVAVDREVNSEYLSFSIDADERVIFYNTVNKECYAFYREKRREYLAAREIVLVPAKLMLSGLKALEALGKGWD